MATIGELIIKIGADARAFTAGLNDVTKQINKWSKQAEKSFGPVMDKIGAGLTALGTAGAAGFIALTGAGVKMNAELEQSKVAFTTMLGSAEKADSFLREMRKFANATPFEFNDLQAAAKKMLAFGFAAEEVKPMLTAVGDAVSGLGGGQEMIDRVTLALGQMKAKSKVSAEEMLQLTEAGIPAWEFLSKAMGKSTAEVMKLSEKGLIPADKAIQALTEGMESKFGGMMEKQSKTMLGLFSTLKDTAATVLTTISGPVFEALKGKLDEVMAKINEWQSNGTLQQWAEKASVALTTVWDAAGKVLNVIVKLGSFILNNWQGIVPIVAGVVASFLAFRTVTTVLAGVKAALDILKISLLTNPIAIITVAVGALAAAFAFLATRQDEYTRSVNNYLENAHKESQLQEGSIKTLETKKSMLEKLGNEYATLKKKLDSGNLSEVEAVKVKADLETAGKNLIPVIGQEGLERIKGAENTKDAVNAEIDAIEGKVKVQKEALRQTYENENRATLITIAETEERIKEIKSEAKIYSIAGKIKAAFLALQGKQAVPGWISLFSEEQLKELDKAEDQITKLREKLHDTSSLDPGDIDYSQYKTTTDNLNNVTTAATGTSKAEKEAAKATDLLKTRLQILQTQSETAAIAAQEHGDKLNELKTNEQSLTQQIDVQKQVVQATTDNYNKLVASKLENTKAGLDAQLEMENEKKALAELEEKLKDNRDEMQKYQDAIDKTKKSVSDLADTYKTEMADALDDYWAKVKKVTDQEKEDIASATKAYEDALKERTNALMNFSGIFEAVTTETVDPATLLTNLQDQVDQFEQWQADLDALSNRGLSSDMIDQLRDLGVGSADQIHALTQMSDEQLAEYVSLWREKYAAAREAATTELTTMQIETQTKIAEIRSNTQVQLAQLKSDWEKTTADITKDTKDKLQSMADSAKTQGLAFMNNIISSILEKKADLAAQLDEIRQMMNDAIDPTVRHSPSLVDRVRSGLKEVFSAYSVLADKMRIELPSLAPVSAGLMSSLPSVNVAATPALAGAGGGNTFYITVNGNNADEILAKLKREIIRKGGKGAF